DPLAHAGGHLEVEDEKGDEVEEGGPDHGGVGAEHPRRDYRGHRIGRVVEAVQEVEGQGQGDEHQDGRRQERKVHVAEVDRVEKVHAQEPLMTISEITWATFLHASTVSSSQPYSSRHLMSRRMSGGLANRALSLSR